MNKALRHELFQGFFMEQDIVTFKVSKVRISILLRELTRLLK